MNIKRLISKNFGTVYYKGKKQEVADKMLVTGLSSVLAVDEQNHLMGIVTGFDLGKEIAREGLFKETSKTVAEIMTPYSQLVTLNPDSNINEAIELFFDYKVNQIPVVREKQPFGLLEAGSILSYYKQVEKKARLGLEELEEFTDLTDNLNEIMVVLDSDLNLRVINKAAKKYLKLSDNKQVDELFKLFPDLKQVVSDVTNSGEAKYLVEIPELHGRNYVWNCIPLKCEHGSIYGILNTLSDVTRFKDLQVKLLNANKELDKAFALTLPNYKVENKLRNTPEYKDIFDPDSGTITITEKIEDGGYRHVINALKVGADLHEQGIMNLVGIDKDALIKTIIFHDIGKTQPYLEKGMIVNPLNTFEDGKVHAARSADFAGKFYDQEEDIINLIYYHHHKAEELPATFPSYLLPSLRLFKIIDGCSAGITRRDAKISFEVKNTKITVDEKNINPLFNKTRTFDLFSGNWWDHSSKECLKINV